MAQQINLDAIAEVRVLLNSYRAEYGRAGGGQVQIVSKSGGTAVPRQPLLLRPSRGVECDRLLREPRAAPRSPAIVSIPSAPIWAGPVPKMEKKLFFFYSHGSAAGEPSGTAAQLDDADRRRDARGLLADPGRAGPADLHPRSAALRHLQRDDRRRRVLPGQHHSGRSHQLERPRAAQHAAAGDEFRSHVHPGAVQPLDPGERREPEDEQHRPGGLAAVEHRQLLLHVQGLVLGSARQRDHRRPEQVGVLQHPLPEHRSWRQRELHEDLPVEPGAGHGRGHPAADRTVLSADPGRLGPDQPPECRLHGRAVPPGAEPAQRDSQGQLQRPELAELHLRQPPGRPGRGVAVVDPDQPDLDRRATTR